MKIKEPHLEEVMGGKMGQHGKADEKEDEADTGG